MIITNKAKILGWGREYIGQSGLPYGDVIFIPKQLDKKSTINTRSNGTLVKVVGNPFPQEYITKTQNGPIKVEETVLKVLENYPNIECASVKLDRKNLMYLCELPPVLTNTMNIKNSRTYLTNKRVTEYVNLDVNLREIKDIVFYTQMVKLFKEIEKEEREDLRDTSFVLKFVKCFDNGKNPFKSKRHLVDAVENKNMITASLASQEDLNTEQAEELKSFTQGILQTILTDEVGNFDNETYTEYRWKLDKIVSIVKLAEAENGKNI